jgi:starch synthase
MDILFCTSEAYPLIKTGGLADVSGSLPKSLRELGNDVRLILPAYPAATENAGGLTIVARLSVPGTSEPVHILEGRTGDGGLRFYLVDSPVHFRRPGNPYAREDGSPWPDNAQRFAVFARAATALALGQAGLDWKPQLVHCHDWQSGLVPPLLSQHEPRPGTLFTIHNLSYQGIFPAATFGDLALPSSLWSINGVEFHGQLSFMKGGIARADWVTTVSPTYAREICTPQFGYGLAGLLQYRTSSLTGILNGIDCEVWNPATDPAIPQSYDRYSLHRKARNKSALLREFGLPAAADTPLLAHIGRLVDQKGIDLILGALDALFEYPVQLIVLGSGEASLEARLTEAAARYPRQLAVRIGHDELLAHRIEAGADCFLMPSRYEPCGLNQMYSLRYGTLPIVRRTGGLADSVVDLNEETARAGTATGFTFREDTAEGVLHACLRAVSHYRESRVGWWKMVIAGMMQDFSWAGSARRYQELYQRVFGA